MEKRLEQSRKELFRSLRLNITDGKVMRAMEQVPREQFVLPEARHLAYDDVALAIGEGQTISQPFMVAFMTSLLALSGDERVLEIGTGSGYQAAILSRLVPRGWVLSLERCHRLAIIAQERLQRLGYDNVQVQLSGDTLGAPERGPFDAIIVTAASPRLPPSLLAQMAPGARLVIPIGSASEQDLVRVIRTGEGPTLQTFGKCRFVPLIDREAWPPGTQWQ